MDGSRRIQCPRCKKTVEVEVATGALLEHKAQPKRNKDWEGICAASGVAVARVLGDGSLAPRDAIDVLNDIDRKLGLAGDRARPKSKPATASPTSVRTVSGGLPSLGRRR